LYFHVNITIFNYIFLGVGAGKGRPEEMWAEMFMLLDEDHDGVIDIDELRDDMETVLKGETRTPEELMAETDTNGDGHIDFDGGYSLLIKNFLAKSEML
jgi:Ca2+-binding EF-hand superfamily protein